MAQFPCSTDLNLGFKNHEVFTKPISNSEKHIGPEEMILDEDIYDFYKKEKIKKLKRKFNIEEMKDFNALKNKSINCFEKDDMMGSKSASSSCNWFSMFEKKLEIAYGHILSPQLRAAVSSCFNYYCTDSTNEQISKYESLIFCIVSLMCKHDIPEDSIDKVNGKASSPLPLAEPATRIMEAQDQCNSKLSFVDLNKTLAENDYSSPYKPASNSLHLFPYSAGYADRGAEMHNSNYRTPIDLNKRLNTIPSKEASMRKNCQDGPSKNIENVSCDVIDLDCVDKTPKDSRIFRTPRDVLSNQLAEKHTDACDLIDLDGADKSPKDSRMFRTPDAVICNQLVDKCTKSPDVEIVHERKFNEKLNILCNKSDDLYNNNMIFLRQSYRRASKGIFEAGEPSSNNCSRNYSIVDEQYCSIQRTLTPSSIIQQFSLSKNFPLAKHDILMYLAACKVSNMESYHDSVAVEIGGVHLKFGKLGQSLSPGGKVGNFLVNILCRKFFLDERPTISMKHYFFSSVADVFMRDTSDFSYVKKCFDGAASVVPLRAVKMLVFPVCHDDHWFVFVVDMKHQHFVFLDSYYCKTDSYQINARKKLISKFIRAWDEVVSLDMPFKSFKVVYPHVPKQERNNRVDCGVFVIKFLELWRSGADLEKQFSQVDICNIRVQVLNDLLFSEHNTADISIVKECAREALEKGWQHFQSSK